MEYLQMLNIHKVYESNNVVALKGAKLEVKRGTVHALVGENGAGKSTLMKILCGLEAMNKGKIFINGHVVKIRNPQDAFRFGIGMVHQHFSLAEDFTAAQNIVLGNEPHKGPFVFKKRILEIAENLCLDSGLRVPLDVPVKALSIGEKQKVEILRILYRGGDILILDEPTSVLTEQEIAELFENIRTLKKKGKTIIFITHKLNEVMSISDEVTVLRQGETVFENKVQNTTKEELAYHMVGERFSFHFQRKKLQRGKILLEVQNLSVMDTTIYKVKDVSFQVHEGEVVGLAGVAGNGQLQLVEAVVGLRKASSGKVFLCGKDITTLTPKQRRETGLGYIPEDRLGVGSSLDSTIAENIVVDRYHVSPFSKWGLLSKRTIESHAAELISRFNVKGKVRSLVRFLSGGNIQKVILARELSADPSVVVVCEPTWGLDIRSSLAVYNFIEDLKERKKGVFLVSSNLDELLHLADRSLVIFRGSIYANLSNDGSLTKAHICEYMTGTRCDFREVKSNVV